MTTKLKPTTKPKRKTKGKRHPLFANSLDHMARDAEGKSQFTLARIFHTEAARVRKIVR